MAFIRYKKINGKLYAYEITSYWNKELKKSKTKSKYVGVVDELSGKVTKFIKSSKLTEKLILDFGDGYFIDEMIKHSNSILHQSLASIKAIVPEIIPLVIYKIITQSAMKNCQTWFDTNILSILYKNINLSSQKISNILGKEEIQRSFFKEYIQSFRDNIDNKSNINNKNIKSIIIDATCMPTAINHQFDDGFFSEHNIKSLYSHNINFITRVPNNRKIFKLSVDEYASGLEHIDNINIYGERSIFIKKIKVNLYNKTAYLYLILYPNKKMKDMQQAIIEFTNISRKTKHDRVQYAKKLLSSGIIGLISSKNIPEKDILSCYYLRQSVEQMFGFLKDDLNLLPIRQHNDSSIRGYVFLQFIALIAFIQIRKILNSLSNKYTVEKALMLLRGIKCKVFEDHIVTSELTKDQKQILEQCDIMMPKKMGI